MEALLFVVGPPLLRMDGRKDERTLHGEVPIIFSCLMDWSLLLTAARLVCYHQDHHHQHGFMDQWSSSQVPLGLNNRGTLLPSPSQSVSSADALNTGFQMVGGGGQLSVSDDNN